MRQIIAIVFYVFAQQVVGGAAAAATTWSAKFTPNAMNMSMDTQSTVWLELSNLNTARSDYIIEICSQKPLLATVLHGNITAAEINASSGAWSGNVTINALFLGMTDIYVQLVNLSSARIEPNTDDVLELIVIRKARVIDHIFTGSVAIFVSLLYINFGAALDVGVLRALLTRPIAPLCGLVCQFLFMPLLSYGLGLLILRDSVEMQLGLFFTGVSPSGGASNIWSVILDGNINLSIMMTAIGNFLAFVMMPFWLFTLGVKIFERANMVVPYANIATFAVSLIVPLAIGLAIQRWFPRAAQVLVRLLKPISSVLILFIIIFATATNLYLFQLFTWQIVVGGLALPGIGYVMGWTIAKLFRQRSADALTIAIETGIQNTGIAIFLLRFSLPQPQADLTTVIPVAVAIMTPLPLLGIYLYKRTSGKIIEQQPDEGRARVEHERMYGATS